MAQVVVELTGDEAKLLRSMQRVVEQNSKTKDSFKTVGKESKTAVDSINDSLSRSAPSLAGMAAGFLSVQTAINVVSEAQTRLIEKQSESLQLAKDLAAAQQEAAKNLAGNTPQDISKALLETVPKIAEKANFSDLSKITTALGSSASIVGEESARSAVEVSAQLTRFKKDDLQSTSTSTADVMKAAGLKDAREAMALLLTSGAVARPEELPKLAGGASKAIYAGVNASPNQAPVEAAKDAAALFAVFSKVDKQGESAATATIQMIDLLRTTFNPNRDDIAKRDDRIAELLKDQAITTEEQVAIDRASLAIQQKQIIANRVDPKDTSLRAQDVRLDLEEAKASLTKALKSSTLTDKESEELRRLQTQKQLAATDPGDLQGRMKAVQQSPELMRTVEANLKGEAAFKAIAQGMFDPDSIHMKGLNEALGSITTDVTKFDDALKTMNLTPQQGLANAGEVVATQVEVNKMRDTVGAAKAQILEIERKALKGTNVDLITSMGSAEVPILDGMARSVGGVGGAAEYSMRTLAGRTDYIANLGAEGTEVTNELKLLVASMQELVNISKQNGVNKESIDRQTAILQDTKAVLSERLSNGPQPNQIRAMNGAK